jgi:uncharacterized protein (DUF2345 family)
VDLAENLVKQGLANDSLRGAGQSGARRESPSQVFGILTPGPKNPDNVKKRLGGHSFVMDDNLSSRMIRLRSAKGNQILLDDTTGVIYMINSKGSWIEMNTSGDISIYAEASINMRAKGNFNLRADKNVNIEAGQDIHLKAAGDNIGDKYLGIPNLGAVGIPPLGNGGNLRLEGTADTTIYAGLNAQLTANGGDVDIGSGSRVAITASGPLGVDLLAATGPIKIQSTGPTSVLSATGFNVTASAPVGITAPLILLNSGAPPAIPALPAVPAPQIGTNKLKDAGTKPPEFDKQSGLDGKTSAPTAGARTGEQPKVSTIVTTLLTAEPYSGHAQYDPVAESAKVPGLDTSLIDKLPEFAVDLSGKPVDINTPEGFLKGTGYTDDNGNPITDFTKEGGSFQNQLGQQIDNVQDAFKGKLSDVTGTASTAAGAALGGAASALGGAGAAASGLANAALGQADALLAGIPQFQGMDDILNNFSSMAETKLLEITGLNGLIDGIKAAIPPIRFPTSNALAQKVIGLGKQLAELEAQLGQFSLDQFGLPLDMLDGAAAAMSGAVGAALASATGSQDFINKLADSGISVIADGPGAIYEDLAGNKLVDFSTGIGPIGATLGAVSDLNKTYDQISGAIQTPLSSNQKLAVTNFAQSIGTEQFLNSNVLSAINEGKTTQEKYGAVPRLMQGWTVAASSPGQAPQQQASLGGQRKYEASLWQCPDDMDVNIGSGYLPGSKNFAELADELDAAREDHLSA